MMRKLNIPMWRDGQLISLSAVLRAVDENDWTWQLRDFSGVGAAPGGEAMQEFEAAVRKSPANMSWGELRRFAEAIEQVCDCLIVGVDRAAGSAPTSTADDDAVGTRLVLEADDSTMWELSSTDAFLLERIANRLAAGRSGSRTGSDT
jgi:hypothetical protein